MAIFLALVIGILWSLFDFIRKQSLKYLNENEVLTVVILSQTILFTTLCYFQIYHRFKLLLHILYTTYYTRLISFLFIP